METGYFSRSDNDALDSMHEDFIGRDGYVWFIEQEETQLWLMESGELTSDPSKAMQFKARMIAIAEKVRRNLHKGWKATEHEFVAILSFASPKEETPASKEKPDFWKLAEEITSLRDHSKQLTGTVVGGLNEAYDLGFKNASYKYDKQIAALQEEIRQLKNKQ